MDNVDFGLTEEELKIEGRAYRRTVVVCDCGKERDALVTDLGSMGEKNVVCCPRCAANRGATPAESLIMRLMSRRREGRRAAI